MDQQATEQVMYERAVAAVRAAGRGNVTVLQGAKGLHASYEGAALFLERMQAEGIVAPADENGDWAVLP